MKLNKNGIYARFYKWFWEDELPKSVCQLFWSLFYASILTPFYSLSYPIVKFFDNRNKKKVDEYNSKLNLEKIEDIYKKKYSLDLLDYGKPTWAFAGIVTPLLLFIVFSVAEKIVENFNPISAIIVICTFSIIGFLIFKRDKSVKLLEIIWVFIVSSIKRVCPRIEWKE